MSHCPMFYNDTIDSSAQKVVNLINNLNRTLENRKQQTGEHRGDNCKAELMLRCIYTYDKRFKETLLIDISSQRHVYVQIASY